MIFTTLYVNAHHKFLQHSCPKRVGAYLKINRVIKSNPQACGRKLFLAKYWLNLHTLLLLLLHYVTNNLG